jgi:hypothetical protein
VITFIPLQVSTAHGDSSLFTLLLDVRKVANQSIDSRSLLHREICASAEGLDRRGGETGKGREGNREGNMPLNDAVIAGEIKQEDTR